MNGSYKGERFRVTENRVRGVGDLEEMGPEELRGQILWGLGGQARKSDYYSKSHQESQEV